MSDFEKIYTENHEEVIFFNDPGCSLKAIVAIHDTTLGPALGGTRLWPYLNLNEALEDCLRLSKAMTYKASLSGLNFGGGKAVIVGNPEKVKSEAFFRSYGRYVESLGGRYITTEDVNTTENDMDYVFTETDNVVGISKIHGGSGNPSPYTALGVFKGMEACCLRVFGNQSIAGKSVVLQGAGSVGYYLGELLDKNGVKIFVSDINKKNLDHFKERIKSAECVDAESIYDIPCDIFAPCALGATINDDTVERLKCKIVAGAANNQLQESCHGQVLKERGILYAPDYLINSGGLMNVALEFEGWSDEKIRKMVEEIYKTTLYIINMSEKENISVCQAADMMAEKRIESIKKIKCSSRRPIISRLSRKRH